MNRADEGALAWALANSATRFLRPGARAWLCAKIGAGEQESAIRDLLTFYANNSKAELPCELAAPIRAWIRGYVGSDSEPLLRRLYDRIKVSDTTQVTDQTSTFTRRRLVAKRSDHAMRARSTCTPLST
ncbi:MAG: hypothetical protein QOJ56_2923 [Mycobacterium sp.]|nr:hypothetical protein [Mycobacterium sp.]